MKSTEYKAIIRLITSRLIKRNFPGLKLAVIEQTSREVAIHVHARMYGANVDGVDSPIWQTATDNPKPIPMIDASELLKEQQT